jgi:acyl-CoA thioesterase I
MNLTIKKLVLILLLPILGLGYFLFARDSNEVIIANLPSRDKVDSSDTKIVAFGDSLTAGYGLSTNETYPAQLEAKLEDADYQVQVINAGVSGETTRGNLERVNFIKNQNPDVVIIGIGGNDALRLLPISETRKNLDETLRQLSKSSTPPVLLLLTMQAPLTAGLAYKKEFDAMYEELAEKHQAILVPFLTAELFFDNKNKLGDGIHYNALGYSKAVDKYIFPIVTQVLDKIQ